MIHIEGYWFPDDCGVKFKKSLTRVKACHYVIGVCRKRGKCGTVVQAGGSFGVWPRLLAACFADVRTFEPDPVSFECLRANTKDELKITSYPWALGEKKKRTGIARNSLTNHKIRDDGHPVSMVPIDAMDVAVCDAILLDVEGYELNAVMGALETIRRDKPLILVERGQDTDLIGRLLKQFGYDDGISVEKDRVFV